MRYCQAMEITYLGHSSFRLKGKTATVVTDPYDARCGKFPKDVVADIVTISHHHSDHDQVKLVTGNPFVIDGAGEYEVKGISVVGVSSWHDDKQGQERGPNTIYIIEMDGLRLSHLGDLGHKLSTAQLEEIGSVDVVFVPVGGVYTLDAATAGEVAKQLDPWIIVPMHYQTPDLKLSNQLAGVDAFLKEMGKDLTAIPKLVISRDKLPQELQVVVLERK